MCSYATLAVAVAFFSIAVQHVDAVCDASKARAGGICRCAGERKTGPAPELVVGEFVRRVTPCGFRDEDSDDKRQVNDRYLWSTNNMRCSHVTAPGDSACGGFGCDLTDEECELAPPLGLEVTILGLESSSSSESSDLDEPVVVTAAVSNTAHLKAVDLKFRVRAIGGSLGARSADNVVINDGVVEWSIYTLSPFERTSLTVFRRGDQGIALQVDLIQGTHCSTFLQPEAICDVPIDPISFVARP
jgi:hypothetical protein